MKLSNLATILLGICLICVLVPVSQYLTRGTTNLDIETGVPVGWAVGLVLSFAIVLAVFKLIARTRIVPRSSLVILYTMLTVAVPVMNLGLVRQLYMNLNAVQIEFMKQGTITYRTAYSVQDPSWFPIVPTTEGLAYNNADVILTTLANDKARTARRKAINTVTRALDRLESGKPMVEGEPFQPDPMVDGLPASIAEAIGNLGPDEARKLLRSRRRDLLDRHGLTPRIEQRLQTAQAASQQALDTLKSELADVDDFALSLVDEFYEGADYSTQQRINSQLQRVSESRRKELYELADERYSAKIDRWRESMGRLSSPDRLRLQMHLAEQYEQRYQALSGQDQARTRVSFTFRHSRDLRNTMLGQAGKGGEPDQNLKAFWLSLWPQPTQQQKDRTPVEKLEDSAEQLPWQLWTRPMLMWGLLVTTIFLLLMCVAEYFRRKWIERENLAFPLVEIADSIIRHDCALEMAEEVTDSPERKWIFSPVFVVGFAIGVLWISMEAMSHYKIGNMGASTRISFYNISKDWFKEGAMKEMNKVFFVLSPIVLGIAFLVSLEITFSVWVMFVIYTLLAFVIKTNITKALIKPEGDLGWAAGREFPFPAEQMLGATLCFAAILIYKSIRTHTPPPEGREETFVPRKLNFVGMVVLPFLALALLWHMGVSSVVLLILFAVIVMANTIASARARAETGLPTNHVAYEMTKAPIVFGLTGISGARAYAAYVSIVFLPVTLLFRSLSSHLENMELARRNRVKMKTIAIATLVAFLVALAVGMASFLVYTYGFGQEVYGEGSQQHDRTSRNVAHYPLWVSHFLGEPGLGQFNDPHEMRLLVIGIGFGLFGLLSYLRNRFLRFPLHPLGYLLLLLGIFYPWVSPYVKGGSEFGSNMDETPLIWGSVFFAWLLKKLVIKYGGMNTYKKAKPLFIGLVVGSVFCVFAWDMVHLVARYVADTTQGDPGEFYRRFQETHPYNPRLY